MYIRKIIGPSDDPCENLNFDWFLGWIDFGL